MSKRVTVDRAVEVLHDRGPGASPRWTVGSGFLIGGRRVLTAAHNVGDGDVSIRVGGRDRYSAELRTCGVPGTGTDLAVLEVDDPSFTGDPSPLGFATVDRTASESLQGCWAVGFPQFKEKASQDGGAALRDTAHLQGHISPGANLVSGFLGFEVTALPRAMPAGTLSVSEWQGMSGAVVFVRHPNLGSLAVGVITEHHRPEGESALTVVPLTAVADLDDATEWWGGLGVEDPGRLTVVPAPVEVEASAYLATVDELVRRTPVLLERETELGDLVSFATGSHAYRWIIGPPWSGKTALAAHLTRSLPPDVDVVAYFLIRRLGDADSSRFLSAVNDQLSVLLALPSAPVDDANELRSLWGRAAERARNTDRHLLLLVDGLDEDVGRPKGLPSVASLLPTLVGDHAHVLVTSRPYPDLPSDLDLEHPLRAVPPIVLSPSAHAAALRERALQELEGVLEPAAGADQSSAQRARKVLCLLAAGLGPMTVDDLAELGTEDPFAIEETVERQVARVVRPVGSADRRRFAFAHDTLRQRSGEYFDRYRLLDPARDTIIGWAQRWAEENWPPESTPTYLLDSYPDLLIDHRPERVHDLFLDFAYVEAAIARAGSDRVAATLHRAELTPGTGMAISALRRLLRGQSGQLRPSDSTLRAGYATRQLCLQALATADGDTVERAERRLSRLAPPRLVPRWTTRRLSQGMRDVLTGHTGWVCSVAVTPDGTRIVSSDGTGTIRTWDLSTGSPVGDPLTEPTGRVRSVAVTPDGTRIVSGGWDGSIRIWDLATGESIGEPLTGHTGFVRSLVVTPDGTQAVSGGWDNTVRVWDLATGAGVAVFGDRTGQERCVALTPDGTRVVSGDVDETVRVWDLATGEPVGEPLTGHTDVVSSVGVTPDGTRIVSASEDKSVRVWDLETGAPDGEPLMGHAGRVTSVAVTPDGTRIVSGGTDATVRVWDVVTRDPVCEPLTGHTDAVRTVAVTPDSARIVSGGEDRTVRVWDLVARAPRGDYVLGHSGRVNSLAVTPDGTHIVSGGEDNTLRVWDVEAGELVGQPFTGHSGLVSAVAVTPDGTRVVSGGWDTTIRVWDLATGGLVGEPLAGHRGMVNAVAVTPDGTRVVSGGWDTTIRVWDLATGEPVGEPFTGHTGVVSAVAVTPDGSRIVSGGWDNTIRVWDVVSGAPVGGPLAGHTAFVRSVAVTPDGSRIVSGGEDGTVRLWDLASGAPLGQPFIGHPGSVSSVAVTPDGAHIVSGGDSTVRIWEPATGTSLMHTALFGMVETVAVAARAGSTFVVAGDSSGSVSLWAL